jgi:CMP-N-acetylneuraminic acid synthetase
VKNRNISVFLPTRKGSQRVKNKNTRPFACFDGGLLQLKLNELIKVSSIREILLSTNDEASLDIGSRFCKKDDRVKVVKRPDHLAQSSTDLTELVEYVPEICESEHILWTHVTSPFVEAADYEKAIEVYFSGLENGFDSLMSAKPFKNFLWSRARNDIINRVTRQKWPQTQDLEELFEIDSALFIASRETYFTQKDRVGLNPNIFLLDSIKSFDVDWEDDFTLAELIYEKHFG